MRTIDFSDPMLEKHDDGVRAYGQSKLAQILVTIDLANEIDCNDGEQKAEAQSKAQAKAKTPELIFRPPRGGPAMKRREAR